MMWFLKANQVPFFSQICSILTQIENSACSVKNNLLTDKPHKQTEPSNEYLYIGREYVEGLPAPGPHGQQLHHAGPLQVVHAVQGNRYRLDVRLCLIGGHHLVIMTYMKN